MFSSTTLHPGLIAQYEKLRNLGLALVVFAVLSIVDLVVACLSKDPAITQWLPVIEPATVMVMLIVPTLLYTAVWRRMKSLQRASSVVRSQPSREMVLKTWKKDSVNEKNVFCFDLSGKEQFGCRTAAFVIVTASDSRAALPSYCEKSWVSKAEITEGVKAFIDDKTGLPVALQTVDALDWVNSTVHEVNDDDREKLLKKTKSSYQLSGEA